MSDYIDNKKLYQAFIDYKRKVEEARKNEKPDPRLPDYIGLAFIMIADNLAKKSSYSGYSYIDEMKDDAIENCVVAANNFDPEKSNNPFAYFTQITKWAFWRRIDKEKRHTYVKYKLYQNMDVSGELYSGDDDFKSTGQTIDDIANDIVYKFEENKKAKDKIKKEKKMGLELLMNEDSEETE